MATTVRFSYIAGQTLTVELHDPSDLDNSTPANGAGGDAATELTNTTGWYSITVSETLSGIHYGRIINGGAVVAHFAVNMIDGTTVYPLSESNVVGIGGNKESADDLSASCRTIVRGTVDTVTNAHTPTTTEFQADDITEASPDHFNGRIVIFTSGALKDQATDITDYHAVGGIGQFTVTAMTEAPANDDTFVIV